jgi:hypothetical protein
MFLAEAATQDLIKFGEPEFVNIADFETLVANISDGILIFPESVGSIAELAYFSNTNAKEKILVANDVNKQAGSFINLGPIDSINQKSVFKPTIFLDFKSSSPNFNLIEERLLRVLPTRQARRFDFRQYNDLRYQTRFFLVFEVINIFRILNLEGITKCMADVFGAEDTVTLRRMISILCAARYVDRRGEEEEYFVPSADGESFFEFRNFDINKLQTQAIDYFSRYDRESDQVLRGVTG